MNATPHFDGLRIAAFESRRAPEMTQLIRQAQGQPFVSPSLREIPLDHNPQALQFAQQLLTGEIDVVIFMTGVGFRYLWELLRRHFAEDRLTYSLSDIVTVARGPKPVAALKEVGLVPTHRVPEPNTWRELLRLVDEQLPVGHRTVAIQEYGESNPSLIAGLEARGATVLRVPVYSWGLPTNLEPLRANIRATCEGERDMLLFTSAQQAVHLLQVAKAMDLEDRLREMLSEVVVGAIGPTTQDALRQQGLPVDFVPTRPKLGPFVQEASHHLGELRRRKRRIRSLLASPSSDVLDVSAPWYDSAFMRACRGEPVDATPIWLMRQAGRYLAEYRAIREKVGFLELCKRPDLCAEIMVTTVQRLGVDAAIIFSDLLPILEPMGLELEYAAGEGPIIHNPLRESHDVDRLLELDHVESLDFVLATVEQTRQALPPAVPLIGFAGAPFTLASYAIEGGSSRHYLHTKTLMYRDEGAWRELMQRLARAVTRYLNAQIRAGAQCVQLFDSWVGCLSPTDYRQFVLPFMADVIRNLSPGVPVISFATGNPSLLPLLAEAGPTVVGADWRIRLDEAWKSVGWNRCIQGNLDPAVLLADAGQVARQARHILEQAAGRPGHIFNLGHGVLPQTPVDNVLRLVHEVKTFRQAT